MKMKVESWKFYGPFVQKPDSRLLQIVNKFEKW